MHGATAMPRGGMQAVGDIHVLGGPSAAGSCSLHMTKGRADSTFRQHGFQADQTAFFQILAASVLNARHLWCSSFKHLVAKSSQGDPSCRIILRIGAVAWINAAPCKQVPREGGLENTWTFSRRARRDSLRLLCT